MDKEITYTIERKLTVGEIKDVITTAVEGGIGYWACLLNDDPIYEKAREDLRKVQEDVFYCDIIYKVLEDGNEIKFQDADDLDEGEIWSLTWDKLMTGIKIYEEKYGKSVHKAMEEADFDANDADMIFQYALFGELIYG